MWICNPIEIYKKLSKLSLLYISELQILQYQLSAEEELSSWGQLAPPPLAKIRACTHDRSSWRVLDLLFITLTFREPISCLHFLLTKLKYINIPRKPTNQKKSSKPTKKKKNRATKNPPSLKRFQLTFLYILRSLKAHCCSLGGLSSEFSF